MPANHDKTGTGGGIDGIGTEALDDMKQAFLELTGDAGTGSGSKKGETSKYIIKEFKDVVQYIDKATKKTKVFDKEIAKVLQHFNSNRSTDSNVDLRLKSYFGDIKDVQNQLIELYNTINNTADKSSGAFKDLQKEFLTFGNALQALNEIQEKGNWEMEGVSDETVKNIEALYKMASNDIKGVTGVEKFVNAFKELQLLVSKKAIGEVNGVGKNITVKKTVDYSQVTYPEIDAGKVVGSVEELGEKIKELKDKKYDLSEIFKLNPDQFEKTCKELEDILDKTLSKIFDDAGKLKPDLIRLTTAEGENIFGAYNALKKLDKDRSSKYDERFKNIINTSRAPDLFAKGDDNNFVKEYLTESTVKNLDKFAKDNKINSYISNLFRTADLRDLLFGEDLIPDGSEYYSKIQDFILNIAKQFNNASMRDALANAFQNMVQRGLAFNLEEVVPEMESEQQQQTGSGNGGNGSGSGNGGGYSAPVIDEEQLEAINKAVEFLIKSFNQLVEKVNEFKSALESDDYKNLISSLNESIGKLPDIIDKDALNSISTVVSNIQSLQEALKSGFNIPSNDNDLTKFFLNLARITNAVGENIKIIDEEAVHLGSVFGADSTALTGIDITQITRINTEFTNLKSTLEGLHGLLKDKLQLNTNEVREIMMNLSREQAALSKGEATKQEKKTEKTITQNEVHKETGSVTSTPQATQEPKIKWWADIDAQVKRATENANNIIVGFTNGINNNLPQVKQAGENIGKAADEGVKESLDEHSPSKVTEEDGKNTVLGFANGVNENLEIVEEAGASFGETIEKAVDTPLDLFYNHGIDCIIRFVDGLRGGRGILDDGVKETIDSAEQYLWQLIKSKKMPFEEVASKMSEAFNAQLIEKNPQLEKLIVEYLRVVSRQKVPTKEYDEFYEGFGQMVPINTDIYQEWRNLPEFSRLFDSASIQLFEDILSNIKDKMGDAYDEAKAFVWLFQLLSKIKYPNIDELQGRFSDNTPLANDVMVELSGYKDTKSNRSRFIRGRKEEKISAGFEMPSYSHYVKYGNEDDDSFNRYETIDRDIQQANWEMRRYLKNIKKSEYNFVEYKGSKEQLDEFTSQQRYFDKILYGEQQQLNQSHKSDSDKARHQAYLDQISEMIEQFRRTRVQAIDVSKQKYGFGQYTQVNNVDEVRKIDEEISQLRNEYEKLIKDIQENQSPEYYDDLLSKLSDIEQRFIDMRKKVYNLTTNDSDVRKMIDASLYKIREVKQNDFPASTPMGYFDQHFDQWTLSHMRDKIQQKKDTSSFVPPTPENLTDDELDALAEDISNASNEYKQLYQDIINLTSTIIKKDQDADYYDNLLAKLTELEERYDALRTKINSFSVPDNEVIMSRNLDSLSTDINENRNILPSFRSNLEEVARLNQSGGEQQSSPDTTEEVGEATQEADNIIQKAYQSWVEEAERYDEALKGIIEKLTSITLLLPEDVEFPGVGYQLSKAYEGVKADFDPAKYEEEELGDFLKRLPSTKKAIKEDFFDRPEAMPFEYLESHLLPAGAYVTSSDFNIDSFKHESDKKKLRYFKDLFTQYMNGWSQEVQTIDQAKQTAIDAIIKIIDESQFDDDIKPKLKEMIQSKIMSSSGKYSFMGSPNPGVWFNDKTEHEDVPNRDIFKDMLSVDDIETKIEELRNAFILNPFSIDVEYVSKQITALEGLLSRIKELTSGGQSQEESILSSSDSTPPEESSTPGNESTEAPKIEQEANAHTENAEAMEEEAQAQEELSVASNSIDKITEKYKELSKEYDELSEKMLSFRQLYIKKGQEESYYQGIIDDIKNVEERLSALSKEITELNEMSLKDNSPELKEDVNNLYNNILGLSKQKNKEIIEFKKRTTKQYKRDAKTMVEEQPEATVSQEELQSQAVIAQKKQELTKLIQGTEEYADVDKNGTFLRKYLQMITSETEDINAIYDKFKVELAQKQEEIKKALEEKQQRSLNADEFKARVYQNETFNELPEAKRNYINVITVDKLVEEIKNGTKTADEAYTEFEGVLSKHIEKQAQLKEELQRKQEAFRKMMEDTNNFSLLSDKEKNSLFKKYINKITLYTDTNDLYTDFEEDLMKRTEGLQLADNQGTFEESLGLSSGSLKDIDAKATSLKTLTDAFELFIDDFSDFTLIKDVDYANIFDSSGLMNIIQLFKELTEDERKAFGIMQDSDYFGNMYTEINNVLTQIDELQKAGGNEEQIKALTDSLLPYIQNIYSTAISSVNAFDENMTSELQPIADNFINKLIKKFDDSELEQGQNALAILTSQILEMGSGIEEVTSNFDALFAFISACKNISLENIDSIIERGLQLLEKFKSKDMEWLTSLSQSGGFKSASAPDTKMLGAVTKKKSSELTNKKSRLEALRSIDPEGYDTYTAKAEEAKDETKKSKGRKKKANETEEEAREEEAEQREEEARAEAEKAEEEAEQAEEEAEKAREEAEKAREEAEKAREEAEKEKEKTKERKDSGSSDNSGSTEGTTSPTSEPEPENTGVSTEEESSDIKDLKGSVDEVTKAVKLKIDKFKEEEKEVAKVVDAEKIKLEELRKKVAEVYGAIAGIHTTTPLEEGANGGSEENKEYNEDSSGVPVLLTPVWDDESWQEILTNVKSKPIEVIIKPIDGDESSGTIVAQIQAIIGDQFVRINIAPNIPDAQKFANEVTSLLNSVNATIKIDPVNTNKNFKTGLETMIANLNKEPTPVYVKPATTEQLVSNFIDEISTFAQKYDAKINIVPIEGSIENVRDSITSKDNPVRISTIVDEPENLEKKKEEITGKISPISITLDLPDSENEGVKTKLDAVPERKDIIVSTQDENQEKKDANALVMNEAQNLITMSQEYLNTIKENESRILNDPNAKNNFIENINVYIDSLNKYKEALLNIPDSGDLIGDINKTIGQLSNKKIDFETSDMPKLSAFVSLQRQIEESTGLIDTFKQNLANILDVSLSSNGDKFFSDLKDAVKEGSKPIKKAVNKIRDNIIGIVDDVGDVPLLVNDKLNGDVATTLVKPINKAVKKIRDNISGIADDIGDIPLIVNDKFSKMDIPYDGLFGSESGYLETFEAKIKAVTEAVNKKTEAFKKEKQDVEKYIGAESKSLETLEERVANIARAMNGTTTKDARTRFNQIIKSYQQTGDIDQLRKELEEKRAGSRVDDLRAFIAEGEFGLDPTADVFKGLNKLGKNQIIDGIISQLRTTQAPTMTVIQQIRSEYADLASKFDAIRRNIKDINELLKGLDASALISFQEELANIDNSLYDFMFTDIGENNILRVIDSILDRGDALKNFAQVLSSSMEKIRNASQEVKKASGGGGGGNEEDTPSGIEDVVLAFDQWGRGDGEEFITRDDIELLGEYKDVLGEILKVTEKIKLEQITDEEGNVRETIGRVVSRTFYGTRGTGTERAVYDEDNVFSHYEMSNITDTPIDSFMELRRDTQLANLDKLEKDLREAGTLTDEFQEQINNLRLQLQDVESAEALTILISQMNTLKVATKQATDAHKKERDEALKQYKEGIAYIKEEIKVRTEYNKLLLQQAKDPDSVTAEDIARYKDRKDKNGRSGLIQTANRKSNDAWKKIKSNYEKGYLTEQQYNEVAQYFVGDTPQRDERLNGDYESRRALRNNQSKKDKEEINKQLEDYKKALNEYIKAQSEVNKINAEIIANNSEEVNFRRKTEAIQKQTEAWENYHEQMKKLASLYENGDISEEEYDKYNNMGNPDDIAEGDAKSRDAITKAIIGRYNKVNKAVESYEVALERVQKTQNDLANGANVGGRLRQYMISLDNAKKKAIQLYEEFKKLNDEYGDDDNNIYGFDSIEAKMGDTGSLQAKYGDAVNWKNDNDLKEGFESTARAYDTLSKNASKYYKILAKMATQQDKVTIKEREFYNQVKEYYKLAERQDQWGFKEKTNYNVSNLSISETTGYNNEIAEARSNQLSKRSETMGMITTSILDSLQNDLDNLGDTPANEQTKQFMEDLKRVQNEYKKLAEIISKIDWSGKSEQDFENAMKDIGKLQEEVDKLNTEDKYKVVNKVAQASLGRKMAEWADSNSAAVEARTQIDALRSELETIDDQGRLNEIAAEFENIKAHAYEAGTAGKSFGDMLGQSFQNLTRYLMSFASFYKIVEMLRKGVNIVMELDKAQTELRKVSDLTTASLRAFQEESFKIADTLGTTSQRIQDSTADWLRLGKSMEEAKEMATLSVKLLNVSEFTDINQATEALVSATQAYKDINPEDIVSKLNLIGNNFAISTDQLATGLQNAAAVLTTQGNSLDETLALLTSSNLLEQDISKASAGMRMISLRIAGTEEAKEQLQELGDSAEDFVVRTRSKTDQIIRDYTAVASNAYKGISVLDANGNLRSTYSIYICAHMQETYV